MTSDFRLITEKGITYTFEKETNSKFKEFSFEFINTSSYKRGTSKVFCYSHDDFIKILANWSSISYDWWYREKID